MFFCNICNKSTNQNENICLKCNSSVNDRLMNLIFKKHIINKDHFVLNLDSNKYLEEFCFKKKLKNYFNNFNDIEEDSIDFICDSNLSNLNSIHKLLKRKSGNIFSIHNSKSINNNTLKIFKKNNYFIRIYITSTQQLKFFKNNNIIYDNISILSSDEKNKLILLEDNFVVQFIKKSIRKNEFLID